MSPLLHRLILPNENVLTLPLRNALDVPSAQAIARFVRKLEIDIVHAHMARDYPIAAFAVRGKPHAKLIVTRHVLFRMNRLQRSILNRAARVIAVSEAVAAGLRASKVVSDDRLTVVHNGIALDRFETRRSGRSELCRNWKLPEDSLLVGSVGELNSLKGHEDFVAAAALVVQELPHTRFVIAGEDYSPGKKNLERLNKLIADLKLDDKVRILGWVSDIPSLLGALDVFVSASLTESFGLSIVEACASGVPPVATETEGAREIIRSGESGLLVPLNDPGRLATAIIQLLKEPELGRRMGECARRDAHERFDLQRMVDATENIYSESLSKS